MRLAIATKNDCEFGNNMESWEIILGESKNKLQLHTQHLKKMALKKVSQFHISAETPEALFRDIKNKKSQGLISHQADILRQYCQPETVNLSDVALQLPTGSGKTVVGLLIAEWRRCHFNEKVVYLCPTVQLVNQVVEQSLTICGIKANAFTGK